MNVDSKGHVNDTFFCSYDENQHDNMHVFAVDQATGYVVDPGLSLPPC
jgi:hypothetical protein